MGKLYVPSGTSRVHTQQYTCHSTKNQVFGPVGGFATVAPALGARLPSSLALVALGENLKLKANSKWPSSLVAWTSLCW
jgi:hypothetical protein